MFVNALNWRGYLRRVAGAGRMRENSEAEFTLGL
jgi:hypothetical protein